MFLLLWLASIGFFALAPKFKTQIDLLIKNLLNTRNMLLGMELSFSQITILRP